MNNKRSISGEGSRAEGKRLQAWRKPKASHDFPCQTRSLIFEEVGEASNFQRTLILHSLRAGQEEVQESS